MDSRQVTGYASSILAVGTGTIEEYLQNEIEQCKSILAHIKSKSTTKATAKLSSIFHRLRVQHTETDLTAIVTKIKELQSI